MLDHQQVRPFWIYLNFHWTLTIRITTEAAFSVYLIPTTEPTCNIGNKWCFCWCCLICWTTSPAASDCKRATTQSYISRLLPLIYCAVCAPLTQTITAIFQVCVSRCRRAWILWWQCLLLLAYLMRHLLHNYHLISKLMVHTWHNCCTSLACFRVQ